MRDDARILIFARTPQAGRVKTRLIPALGAQWACELHARMVERTLALAARSGVPVELWLDGEPSHPSVAAWRTRYRLRVRRQRGAGLGARLHDAIQQTLRTSRSALVLGCDCVTLTQRDLQFALRCLPTLDAVIAPARDGGYVLLGVSRPATPLLQRIPWGTRHVLAATRRRMHTSGWRYRLLGWQHDVDRPADLPRALRELGATVPAAHGAGSPAPLRTRALSH
ncbi:MAG: TIGR04282 family arsenosugar biosynthesis glycosyltransferase [Gammaproteobacteria bacterium]|nr:TIGR04282 family arsenosugar biosynthesis glycosyltransferase [Gammaproteobacteria bacterium]